MVPKNESKTLMKQLEDPTELLRRAARRQTVMKERECSDGRRQTSVQLEDPK